jgi:anti-sigma factor RsiW
MHDNPSDLDSSFSGMNMMSPDDESFLSAYLDGELDAEERQVVERCLTSKPHLAETLRGLLRVRDLVSELSRPAPADTSLEVMRRIRASLLRSRPWKRARPLLPWVVAGFGAAAVIGLLILVTHHPENPGLGTAPFHRAKASPPPERSLEATENVVGIAAIDRPASLPTSAQVSRSPNVLEDRRLETTQVASRQEAAEDIEARDLMRVRALLDDPSLPGPSS